MKKTKRGPFYETPCSARTGFHGSVLTCGVFLLSRLPVCL